MSTSTDILFLDSRKLGHEGSLEQILQVFIDLAFQLDEIRVQSFVFDREQYQRRKGEILDKAYKSQTLTFKATNPVWSLEILQQIAWGTLQMGAETRAYIRTSTDNTGFWRAGYDNERYCSFILDIGKRLYNVLEPTFGWIDLYYGWTTTHEDIEALELRMLYWANFFGPELVKKLSCNRILNAPAWQIDALNDGGLLYILAPHLGLTDAHVPIEDVKRYWVVKSVR